MLIEVIICALALLVLVGGAFGTRFFRVDLYSSTRKVLMAKGLWCAMVAALPLSLHLPLAILYYRGAQTLGHAPVPMMNDPKFWIFGSHDPVFLFLAPVIRFTFGILFYPLVFPWILPLILFGIPALTIFLGRRYGHLSKRDYGYVLLCLITSWGSIFFATNAVSWWLD